LATSSMTVVPAPSVGASALSRPSNPPSTTSARKPDCVVAQAGFDCDFQKRIAAVSDYVAKRPGTVGIVLRDRQTGAVWRNGQAGTAVWTASTIKLAMVVDLLLRDRAGTVRLTAADRALIKAMLHSSDDNAADTLWSRYGGADHTGFNAAFGKYGMTSLRPQRGYS
jgi:hypothetical protein